MRSWILTNPVNTSGMINPCRLQINILPVRTASNKRPYDDNEPPSETSIGEEEYRLEGHSDGDVHRVLFRRHTSRFRIQRQDCSDLKASTGEEEDLRTTPVCSVISIAFSLDSIRAVSRLSNKTVQL